MHFQSILYQHKMAYKLKNDEEVLSVKGFRDPFRGEVDEQVYNLLIKARPELAEKFEQVEDKSSSPVKSDE